MKSILYRGGVVRFRIPTHWVEEYSDIEGGMFYEDNPDSGTLRLKVITLSTAKELHARSAQDILEVVVRGLDTSVEGETRSRKDGNAVLRYEEAAFEQGMPLRIVYWVIANPLPPHDARIVTFSFTMLASQRNEESVQRDLETLEEEIDSAIFAPELGVISDELPG